MPAKDEKPIMGLVSDKNFIVSNAVENILAAPNLPANKDKDYLIAYGIERSVRLLSLLLHVASEKERMLHSELDQQCLARHAQMH